MTRAPDDRARSMATSGSYALAVMSMIAKSAHTRERSNSGAVFARAGSAPAASTALARRSAQIRSCARIATVVATTSSVDRLGEVVEDVACGDDAGRSAVLDDRDVTEAADRHLVDRDRDRVVVAEHDRVGRHEVTHVERVE